MVDAGVEDPEIFVTFGVIVYEGPAEEQGRDDIGHEIDDEREEVCIAGVVVYELDLAEFFPDLPILWV